MMWWHGSPGWGGWLVMALMMVIFSGAVIFAGIVAWRAANRSDRQRRQVDERSPEQLLDERFARGEIDADEYTHRRELLHSRR